MEIFLIFAAIAFLGLVAYGFQILAIRKKMGEQGTGNGGKGGLDGNSYYLPSTVPFSGISILKPLKGLDDNLFDNLESLCLQDYPEYEIIFALQDVNDPAYKVARKIKDKYPGKNITLLVERCDIGLNPKVNNLMPAYRMANYDYILVSDSNVIVGTDYLRKIMEDMRDPDVGLVSNLIQGIGGRTLGSVFENLHLNSFIIGSVCFLDRFLKMPCVIGKSMLMRKKDLEAIGGFRGVKDVLAEDYLIGKRMETAGKKVVLSNYVIRNVNEYWSFRRFLNRHTRWGKLRWRIGGLKYISELIGNPIFISFMPIFFCEPSKLALTFAFAVSSLKVAGDLYVGRMLRTPMGPLTYFLTPVKDFIIGIIWFVPILSNTVAWRGNRYIIGRDTVLAPCGGTGLWSWRCRLADAVKARFA